MRHAVEREIEQWFSKTIRMTTSSRRPEAARSSCPTASDQCRPTGSAVSGAKVKIAVRMFGLDPIEVFTTALTRFSGDRADFLRQIILTSQATGWFAGSPSRRTMLASLKKTREAETLLREKEGFSPPHARIPLAAKKCPFGLGNSCSWNTHRRRHGSPA